MNMNLIAWLLALVTAVWLGLLAVRSGKNSALWALAGGLLGLVSSTFVFGLGRATAIPFSDRERNALQFEWALIAIAIIALVGGLITWTLLRQSRQANEKTAAGPAVEKKGK